MRLNHYLTVLAVIGVIGAGSVAGLAHGDDDQNPSLLLYPAEETSDFEEIEDVEDFEGVEEMEDVENIEDDSSNLKETEEFIQRLNRELNLSKTEYRQLLSNITDTRKRLESAREEKMTLQEQLSNIDDQISLITSQLISVLKQIVEKENQISLLFEEIEIREIALEYQKNLVRDYIRILYQEENNLFFFEDDGSVNAFKLLLADGSVSENLRDLDYLNLLRETGTQLIDKLDQIHSELEEKRIELSEKRAELEELKDKLEIEREQLEIQKSSKEDLLRITRGQETIYSQLVEETEREQEQMIADVRSLTDAIAFIERKAAEEGEYFDLEKYRSVLSERDRALIDLTFDPEVSGDVNFIWPVEPNRGISAYFRDSSYYGVFGVQHNAIDIPVYQGSPVRSAADGIVYTARDNGYGYSYIILAHANGFKTVYGHISAILVEEGQVVNRGTIIGLSGGMPGTLGAGYMTTGPHLHLEFLLNGRYVDPLKYLPLENLSEGHIERLPEKYFEAWEKAKFRSLAEPVLR